MGGGRAEGLEGLGRKKLLPSDPHQKAPERGGEGGRGALPRLWGRGVRARSHTIWESVSRVL